MSFLRKFQNKYTSLFLRKNKTFLKSKITRTRQWSKTIVFFGLWFNIGSIYFCNLYFYQWYINLSYYWWAFSLLIGSFFLKSYFHTGVFKNHFKWLWLYSNSFVLIKNSYYYFTKMLFNFFFFNFFFFIINFFEYKNWF